MLSGKTRYRRSFFGKFILQVEEVQPNPYPYDPSPYDIPPPSWKDSIAIWRDAKFLDFQEKNFNLWQ